MYYTIEGKRVLAALYIVGLLAGSFFLNITIKMNLFKVSDFLDFTEYMKMLKNMDLTVFATYVFLVRFRQLLLFFLCLFLFSPYIIFCILDVLVSVFTGILISVMTLKYGLTGVVRAALFLFPQYIFYGVIFAIIYIYLFRFAFVGGCYAGTFRTGVRGGRKPLSGRTACERGQRGIHDAYQRTTLLKHRIMIVLVILLLFFAGCAAESFLNPIFLRKIFS